MRYSKLSTLAVAAGGLVVLTTTTGASRPDSAMTYGFELASMQMAFYRGDEKIDCPDGRSHTVREAYLATQTPAERARLQKPENSVEFEKKYKGPYVMNAHGQDICTDQPVFDTPERETQKLVQSKIGPGLNLDGTADGHATAQSCPHQKFVSPTGQSGVDNQFFRAVACNTAWRGASTGIGDFAHSPTFKQPGTAAVVLVRNVHSWVNDPDVEVVIAGSPETPQLDAGQNTVAGASLVMTSNPRYRNVLKGRIENGVLTTAPGDLVLPYNWNANSGGEYILHHVRLRVHLTPEGGLTGEAGGYQPIDAGLAIGRVGGPGVASVAGLECASVRKTLRLLADGDRDPKTGQCATVSIGLTFEATPAFVFENGHLAGGPVKVSKALAQR